MIVIMEAMLLFRSKDIFPDGAIIEIVVWSVPAPVPGSAHSYKYRLFYGLNGVRIVGYDNERGKGDHCHRDGSEFPYHFTSPQALLSDFKADVDKRRKQK